MPALGGVQQAIARRSSAFRIAICLSNGQAGADMKLTRILTFVFLLALVVLVLIGVNASVRTGGAASFMVTQQFIVNGLGAVIALSSGLLLLLRALDRDAWNRMPPLIVPLAAGLLLMNPHWSLGLLLAVVAAGVFARDIFRGGGSGGSGQPRRFRRSANQGQRREQG